MVIAEIGSDTDRKIRNSQMWLANEELLMSVPGVSSASTRILQAHLPELGELSRRKVGALAGPAPYAHESGEPNASSTEAEKRPGRGFMSPL